MPGRVIRMMIGDDGTREDSIGTDFSGVDIITTRI